jgi:sensor domain CHASE-containing protein/HAMP domain-containing protein
VIAVLAVAVPLRLIFDRILLDGFERLETAATTKDVARVKDALDARVESMSVKARDWAWWDDAFTFAGDRNQEFIDSNLAASSVATMGLEAILMFDSAGDRIATSCVDLGSGEEAPLFPALERRFVAGSPLLAVDLEKRAIFGHFLAGGDAWSFASTAILRTDQTGPSNGVIVFARRIDDAFVAELSDVTHLAVRLHRLSDVDADLAESAETPPMPPDLIAARPRLATGETVLTRLSESSISGMIALPDFDGGNDLAIRVVEERAVHAQAIATRYWSALALMAGAVVLAVTVLWLTERTVVRPLSRLSKLVHAVEVDGNLLRKVPEGGPTELD